MLQRDSLLQSELRGKQRASATSSRGRNGEREGGGKDPEDQVGEGNGPLIPKGSIHTGGMGRGRILLPQQK